MLALYANVLICELACRDRGGMCIVQSHMCIVHNATILTDVHVEGEMALALSVPAPLDSNSQKLST